MRNLLTFIFALFFSLNCFAVNSKRSCLRPAPSNSSIVQNYKLRKDASLCNIGFVVTNLSKSSATLKVTGENRKINVNKKPVTLGKFILSLSGPQNLKAVDNDALAKVILTQECTPTGKVYIMQYQPVCAVYLNPETNQKEAKTFTNSAAAENSCAVAISEGAC